MWYYLFVFLCFNVFIEYYIISIFKVMIDKYCFNLKILSSRSVDIIWEIKYVKKDICC